VFTVGLVNLLFLVEYPQSMNLEIKEHGEILDPSKAEKDEGEDDANIPSMPFWQAVMIPGVLQFAFSFYFIKFAFYGNYYWIPTYLIEQLGYQKSQVVSITSVGSTGGIIGSILMGFLSDLIAIRSPVHLMACAVGATSLSLLTSIKDN
jgi:sugar phosphate permease